ncbi:hypothetical protein IWX49DRAFT_564866 [Phyllosticta citricarpa]|uniref:Uncharacterized protein n=2 Tax=Phyllosticta TaxID=121621 RepID=A0ABR1MCV4_9PEZI
MAMAANQTLPGLQVTAPEEDMEISDYERTADDIDIDIDISVEPIREEDDYMVDDRSEHENKDDIMLDGDGQEDEDGMMQDNFSVPDEHLTDASEVGYVDIEVKEAPHETTDTEVRDGDQVDDFIDYDDNVNIEPKEEDQIPIQHSEIAPPTTHIEPGNNQIVDAPETGDASFHQAAENNAVSHQVESLLHQEAGPQNQDTSEDNFREQTDRDVKSSEIPTNPSVESEDKSPVGEPRESHTREHHSGTEANAPEDAPSNHEVGEKHSNQDLVPPVENVDCVSVPEPSRGTDKDETAAESSDNVVNLSHEKQNVGEQQSMSTHSLHPVVVVYNEDEISLFPPNDGDTSGSYYFLQDEELAHGSIRALLEACRQVLGDTVQQEDELEIDVAELGLRVSEESLDAAQCTFAQVLDAYIQLHRNDGVEAPGPLYVALSTRTKFSARLEFIMKAVSDGKGLSQLPIPDYTAEEEPYSDSPNHHQPEPKSNTEGSGQAPGTKGVENVSAHGSPTRECGDDPESNVNQEQESMPNSSQSANAGAGPSSADANPGEKFPTDGIHDPDGSCEAGEESYAEELPEYDSEDENTAYAGADAGEYATGDFSTAPHNGQSDFEDVQKGDDGESHGSSTIRGDNTPATMEGGTLATIHGAESVAQHVQTESESFAGTNDAQEFDDEESANPAGQDGHGRGEYGNAQEHEPHVEEEGYAGEEKEEHEDGAQGFDESGFVGQEYEYAGDDPNQQHEPDFNDQEEQFDLPSDNEHDRYDEQDPQAFRHGDQADKTQVQEKGSDSNEAAFADNEVVEYVVVENEDAHEQTADEKNSDANDRDGPSSHGDESDDAYAHQTAENNEDATLAELGAEVQRTADDQDHPASPIAGGVDDDTIDYDDEELSRQSDEEASTAEGVAPSPSSFKRTWEEFDHGEDTADNDQALKKVKSG